MIEIIYFSWELLLPVVQRLDNAIHRINRYPVDKCHILYLVLLKYRGRKEILV